MAAALRPHVLRQAFAAAPAKRVFSTAPLSASLSAASAARVSRRAPLQSALKAAAAFHTSQPRAILPPLPQVIKGTVNDAALTPDPSALHGSYHWSFERLMSAALVPLTIAPFAAGSLNPVMDAVLCATILIHSHIGFESCITDYFPGYRTPGIKKALMWVLKAATVLVGVGLYEFETNDVGVTAAIGKIWSA
ncbi:hypothetical protein MBLNU459_g0463t1 [Dothideomycetes sp. NU459]